jgi:hypothetical protein
MPAIACLAWGSLVWDHGELPIQSQWFSDGPWVRVEFLRQSTGGRITLVLDPTGAIVRSLWAVMNSQTLDRAKADLCDREGIPREKAAAYIGTWSKNAASPLIVDLPQWAEARGLESVIWTALPPKFNGQNRRVPTAEEVVSYLSGLTGRVRDDAERYIRFAPKQIDTYYRRRIETALQWTSLGSKDDQVGSQRWETFPSSST